MDMRKLGRKGEAPLVAVRLPSELLKELRQTAEDEGRTVSEYIRELVERSLARKKGGRA